MVLIIEELVPEASSSFASESRGRGPSCQTLGPRKPYVSHVEALQVSRLWNRQARRFQKPFCNRSSQFRWAWAFATRVWQPAPSSLQDLKLITQPCESLICPRSSFGQRRGRLPPGLGRQKPLQKSSELRLQDAAQCLRMRGAHRQGA